MKIHLSWRLAVAFATAIFITGAAAAHAQDTELDPKAIELGAQLVDLAGSKKIMSQMLEQMGPALTHLMERANPGKEAEADEVMNQFVLPKIAESLPEMEHESAMLYARHFTTDELGQLVAFYQSPVGRKLVDELPGMLREMSAFAQTEGQKVALDALKAYADEFRKRGLQTPI